MHTLINNKMHNVISYILMIEQAILHIAVIMQWPHSPQNKSSINILHFLHYVILFFSCNFL